MVAEQSSLTHPLINIQSLAMKQSIRILLSIFTGWVALFILAKLVFMACYHHLYAGTGIGDICAVIWHGLKMDLATAGYLTAIPGLILTVGSLFRASRPTRIVLKAYTAVMSLLVLSIICTDTALYGYWDFKLDITPLFYVMTDPAAALASAPQWMVIASVPAIALLTWGVYCLMTRLTGIDRYRTDSEGRARTAGVMLLLTALLFIPIRGGFGVATVNLSTAFYSNNMRLNHAAVNPAFSLIYSATHQQAFDKMFRFMEQDDADIIMARVTESHPSLPLDTTLLSTTRPDIYIIILESFSNSLFPSTGGEPIAIGLDSIGSTGLMFNNLYSSSFRTDRAIPAILNAFPAQPTTSLSKYPEKTRHIPSLARSLEKEGYKTAYYYGGDATFANMQTYLLNSGFGNLITIKDMNENIERGKWGVPDGALFDHIINNTANDTLHRHLTVIQTLSSHEPFEVPYSNPACKNNAACNAFAYTDSCTTAFINTLASMPGWNNTLVIAVPDHYGCYPHNPDPTDVILRHRIPLIMTGGALNRRGIINTTASQTDIIATLLDAMGIDHDEYRYSRNILTPTTTPMAFMSTPTYTAVVDTTGVASVYHIDTRLFDSGHSHPSTEADSINAAYLQTIYNNLHNL